MQTKENNVVDIKTRTTAEQDLQRYMNEVKIVLKSKSKNELIRTVGALLLDNYALKEKIASLMPKEEAKPTEEDSK